MHLSLNYHRLFISQILIGRYLYLCLPVRRCRFKKISIHSEQKSCGRRGRLANNSRPAAGHLLAGLRLLANFLATGELPFRQFARKTRADLLQQIPENNNQGESAILSGRSQKEK